MGNKTKYLNLIKAAIIALLVFSCISCSKVDSLIQKLKDKDPDVRREAAKALGEIKDARAVEPLIAALKDENSRVREIAAYALGKIKDPRAVEPLIAALKDVSPSPDVREAAVRALGEIKDVRIVEPLIAALKDRDRYVRSTAVSTLGEIKDVRIVEPLIAALKDGDSNVRYNAVSTLGEIKDARAVEPLIAALKDGDSYVREKAAKALGEIKDARAVEPLIAALMDEYSHVRENAVKALVKIGTPAVEPLIAAASWKGQEEVAEALVKIGTPAVEPLIAALKDEHWYVRKKAAGVLGEIKDPRAVEPLIAAALKDEDSHVRWRAVEALVKIGAPAIEPLIAVLKDDDSRAVELLIAALKDEDSEVRYNAVEALGKMGDKRAINPLVENLTDWDLNKTVAKALASLGWKPQSDRDKIHFLVAQRNGPALKEDWNTTKAVLLKDVESNDYGIFENALYAFIAIGKEEIIPELIKKLDEKGDTTIVVAYLNCGHSGLAEAARDWARRHGYMIMHGSGSAPVGWGRW